MAEQQEQKKQIPISFPENLRGGAYCNLMRVEHTREEFVMDFMLIAAAAGAVTARVIMSPGHMKRTVAALKSNLDLYEKNIGPITEAPEPSKGQIGYVKN